MKFTTEGSIYLKVDYYDKEQQQVCFSVRDEGIGIAENQLDKLFEGYEQANSSIARQFGGTGLGLPICKRLATLMKGRLEVSSKQGEGSCFRLIVPLDAATNLVNENRPIANNDSLKRPLHILFAEDNPVNIHVLSAFMKKLECSFQISHNGQQAIAAYLASLKGNLPRFDCILMDCEMPILGGIEATEEIRKKEIELGIDKGISIFALTGHVLPEYAQRCSRAGMNKVLTKPIDMNQLIRTLNSVS